MAVWSGHYLSEAEILTEDFFFPQATDAHFQAEAGEGYIEGYEQGYLDGSTPNFVFKGGTVVLLAKNGLGQPLAGLTPTWVTYKNAVTNTSPTQPTITALGDGSYKFTPTGDNPAGIIDLGATANPRYVVYTTISPVWVFAAFDEFGAPLPGLTPTWHSLRKVSTGANHTPQPAISELGAGLYKTTFITEHVTGAIDLGATAYPKYVHFDTERPVITILIPE